MSDADKYVETQLGNGGVIVEFVNPPPVQTHKTSDIAREEWALNFTPTETALMDKLKIAFATQVVPDLSFISFSGKTSDANGFKTKAISDDAGAVSSYYAGQTLLDLARSSFARYAEMTGGLSVNDPRLIGSIQLFHLLGWLDNKDRATSLLLGVPFSKLSK